MKKLIALMLILCMLLGMAGCASEESAEESAAESTEPVEAAEPIVIRSINYDKLYALHDADEIVARVGDWDVSWGEYFYLLFAQCQQMSQYFASMASYYGIAQDWADTTGEDTEETYASMIPESVELSLNQLQAILGFAKSCNTTLSQESRDAMAKQLEQDIVSMCGEGASEADFEKHLETIYMSRDMYDKINEINYIYQDNFINLYGANGEKVSDKDAMAYLEENGYLNANHILLATVDLNTREPLEESVVNEKKALAEETAAKLQAISDREELLSEFAALKTQLCEDSGKVTNPDGYIFTPGTMVPEFENTCKSLESYEVSEPILSSYGYHIIMRLPLEADTVLQYSNAGTELTARSLFANTQYGQRLQQYLEGVSLEYAEGFEPVNLLDYVE